MDNDLNFETFLFVSEKKLIIYVNSKADQQIYKKELILEETSTELNFDILDYFLNENIFKIEKLLKNFVKNIYVIIDCEEFFSIDISLKKKNYGEFITTQNLNYILNEARDQCSSTLVDKKIIHILIDKYLIDDKQFSNLPQNLKCNHFSLDINFICLPINYIKKIENILSKYQVSINRLISMKYLESLFLDQNVDFSEMAKKVIDGHNLNEVVLSSKKSENMSFFEKFFHFFT
jgi:hypothetical protein